MKTSNFPYPKSGRYIVQGEDAGKWLDSKFHFTTPSEAVLLADEKRRTQGGQWRVVLNKFHATPYLLSNRDRVKIQRMEADLRGEPYLMAD